MTNKTKNKTYRTAEKITLYKISDKLDDIASSLQKILKKFKINLNESQIKEIISEIADSEDDERNTGRPSKPKKYGKIKIEPIPTDPDHPELQKTRIFDPITNEEIPIIDINPIADIRAGKGRELNSIQIENIFKKILERINNTKSRDPVIIEKIKSTPIGPYLYTFSIKIYKDKRKISYSIIRKKADNSKHKGEYILRTGATVDPNKIHTLFVNDLIKLNTQNEWQPIGQTKYDLSNRPVVAFGPAQEQVLAADRKKEQAREEALKTLQEPIPKRIRPVLAAIKDEEQEESEKQKIRSSIRKELKSLIKEKEDFFEADPRRHAYDKIKEQMAPYIEQLKKATKPEDIKSLENKIQSIKYPKGKKSEAVAAKYRSFSTELQNKYIVPINNLKEKLGRLSESLNRDLLHEQIVNILMDNIEYLGGGQLAETENNNNNNDQAAIDWEELYHTVKDQLEKIDANVDAMDNKFHLVSGISQEDAMKLTPDIHQGKDKY